MCTPSTGKPSQYIGGKPGTNYASVGTKPRSQFGPPVTPAPPVPPLAPLAPLAPLPSSSNTILSTMALPGGLATIESLTASPFALNAPDLEDPMGSLSQQVQRKKAQLSIAK